MFSLKGKKALVTGSNKGIVVYPEQEVFGEIE